MSDRLYAQIRDLAGPVSRETFEKLLTFEKLFLKWSEHFNLVAPSTIGTLWERHILDSVQILPLGGSARNWLDLGSGGGFPGAIIAILLCDRPGAQIDLVESNGKKAAFLSSALRDLDTPGRVHKMRIEACEARFEDAEILTARALAPLPVLLGLALPWLSSGGRGLFHKGRDFENEIKESRDHWRFGLVEHRDRIDPKAKIIEISGLRRRHDGSTD